MDLIFDAPNTKLITKVDSRQLMFLVKYYKNRKILPSSMQYLELCLMTIFFQTISMSKRLAKAVLIAK